MKPEDERWHTETPLHASPSLSLMGMMGNCCSTTDWMQGVGNIIQAFFGIVIGVAAICLTVVTNRLADAANTLALAAIRPYLLVQTSHGKLFIKVVLKNDGGGPAIINSVTYQRTGAPMVTDTKAEHDAHPDDFYGLLDYKDHDVVPRADRLENLLANPSEPADNNIGYKIAGEALGTGKELVLLACKVQNTDDGRAFLNSIRASLDGAVITIRYQDARPTGPEERELKHPLSVSLES